MGKFTVLGVARVCISTSPAPEAAAMSATAGSSRPLVSLISAAPACTAAAIVSARQVSSETSTP